MISNLNFYAPDISILLGEPLRGHSTSQNDHIRLSKDCILTGIGFLLASNEAVQIQLSVSLKKVWVSKI